MFLIWSGNGDNRLSPLRSRIVPASVRAHQYGQPYRDGRRRADRQPAERCEGRSAGSHLGRDDTHRLRYAERLVLPARPRRDSHQGGHANTIANGPAIDPDGRFLTHTDTALKTTFRFDIKDDGSLGPRRPFITFERDWGNPEGMTFDADGHLWVACWGSSRVIRVTSYGARERSIALPASQIAGCTFAGPNLDRMLATSAAINVDEPLAEALFEVNPGCRGLAVNRFRG